MQRRRRPPVQAADVRPAQVGEPGAPSEPREADLAGVQMAREDELEHARLEPVDHVWEMAEQDAEVGARIREPLGPSLAAPVRPRVDADDLDTAAAQLERPRVVDEQDRFAEVGDGCPFRERIARDREVVVAEDGVAARQPREQLPQPGLGSPPREQVAADEDEVR